MSRNRGQKAEIEQGRGLGGYWVSTFAIATHLTFDSPPREIFPRPMMVHTVLPTISIRWSPYTPNPRLAYEAS